MNTHKRTLLAALFAFVGLSACSKSTETQMQKYLAFYYPSNSETSYEISFDWGVYDIYTTGPAQPTSNDDDARYGGYIVARPTVSAPQKGKDYWTYLVTPSGKVWRRVDGGNIPSSGHRKKVTKTTHGSITTTSTLTIDSPAEPAIDDFLNHPDQWSGYGTLVPSGTDAYRLKRS